MADKAELDSRIARIEAALIATADALETAQTTAKTQADAAPDHGAALKKAEDELADARQKIEALEQLGKDRETTLNEALERAKAAEALMEKATSPNDTGPDTSALQARIADLQAARAQDLAEMKTLLAELEPMLETDNA